MTHVFVGFTFHTTGDLWGPDFEKGPFLSEVDLGIPHDSAEGYLFEFHFNLQHMHFLRETNALAAEQEREIINYLNRGEGVCVCVCVCVRASVCVPACT